jgi:hypothetical protein
MLPQRPFRPAVQSESLVHVPHKLLFGAVHVDASGETAARSWGHAEPAGR